MDFRNSIPLYGFLGGVSPSLITVARLLQGSVGADERRPDLLLFCIGAIVYGIIGTICVSALGERLRKKAYLMGIAAPSLIIAITQPLPKKNLAYWPETGWFPFISSAYAQEPSLSLREPPSSTRVPQRTVGVHSKNQENEIAMSFLDSSGRTRLTVQIPAGAAVEAPTPEDATSVKFEVGDQPSRSYPIPSESGSLVEFTVKSTTRLRYGLFSAFGQKPKIEVTFSITSTELNPPLMQLLTQIDSSDVDSRTKAVNRLALEEPFRLSPATNAVILEMLKPDAITKLSPQGLINCIVILTRHELSSWTPQLAARARETVSVVLQKYSNEPRVADVVRELLSRLNNVARGG